MLEARALFYAVIVSLLIAVVSGTLISLAYLQGLQQIDQFDQNRMIRNVNSGIELVKSGATDFEPLIIDLYGNQDDSIKAGQLKWGFFDIGYSQAIGRLMGHPDTLTKVFYLGEKNNPTIQPALFLADHSAELSLAGNNILRGTALIPNGREKHGVANIAYTGYAESHGQRANSPRQLPKFNEQRMKELSRYFKKRTSYVTVPKKLNQSFMDSTIYVSGHSIQLGNVELTGNIIVMAKDSIYVSAEAKLEDLLLFAPKIIFEDGFEGQVQAFASNAMTIGEGAAFRYPSVLGLLRDEKYKEEPQFLINPNAEINGLVLVYESKYFRKPTYLKIEKESIIRGQVFADAKVDFRGIIYGNLSCSGLWYESSVLKMKNLLFDTTIDRAELSAEFVSPFIAKEVRNLALVKWIEDPI